MEQTDNALK